MQRTVVFGDILLMRRCVNLLLCKCYRACYTGALSWRTRTMHYCTQTEDKDHSLLYWEGRQGPKDHSVALREGKDHSSVAPRDRAMTIDCTLDKVIIIQLCSFKLYTHISKQRKTQQQKTKLPPVTDNCVQYCGDVARWNESVSWNGKQKNYISLPSCAATFINTLITATRNKCWDEGITNESLNCLSIKQLLFI